MESAVSVSVSGRERERERQAAAAIAARGGCVLLNRETLRLDDQMRSVQRLLVDNRLGEMYLVISSGRPDEASCCDCTLGRCLTRHASTCVSEPGSEYV